MLDLKRKSNRWGGNIMVLRDMVYCNMLWCIILFTNPSARAGYDTRSVFKRSLTGLNSEFSFSETRCLTKAEETSLSYYLPIAGGRIIGFISFPRVLVLCEMQSVSSRIWIHVALSNSYDNNHYTTGTSIYAMVFYAKLLCWNMFCIKLQCVCYNN